MSNLKSLYIRIKKMKSCINESKFEEKVEFFLLTLLIFIHLNHMWIFHSFQSSFNILSTQNVMNWVHFEQIQKNFYFFKDKHIVPTLLFKSKILFNLESTTLVRECFLLVVPSFAHSTTKSNHKSIELTIVLNMIINNMLILFQL